MALIQELMKGIVAQFTTSVDLSGVPFYFDHAPQETEYPIITYKVISAPRTWSMTTTTPHKYANVRIQFSIFGNENQLSDCLTIANKLETLYDFQDLTLANSVTHICTKINDEAITFFNEKEKVWTTVQDIRVMIGI